ncbi:MAG: hypothetical protein LASZOEIN_002057 [Candidatus Fervidibacter sp.]|jgi:hypothetical protein
MTEWLNGIAGFVKELGFPIVVALWLMYFVNKVMTVQEIVNALIRIDEKIERLMLMLERDGDGT